MSGVERYLSELDDHLRVRGRTRRRFLRECRDHLDDGSRDHGAEEAVRRFGDVAELARAYTCAVATRRRLTAALVTAVSVAVTAVSTLALLNGVAPGAPAVVPWAVVFFAAAQTSAVATVLSLVLAGAICRAPGGSGDLVLLGRRGVTALVSAQLTLFAAAAAVPGHAPVAAVMAGPAAGLVAAVVTVWARWSAPLPDRNPLVLARSPWTDLIVTIRGRRGAAAPYRPVLLLSSTVVAAGLAAFVWDGRDDGTTSSSAMAAVVEIGLVLVGFFVLGRRLGLRGGVRHPWSQQQLPSLSPSNDHPTSGQTGREDHDPGERTRERQADDGRGTTGEATTSSTLGQRRAATGWRAAATLATLATA